MKSGIILLFLLSLVGCKYSTLPNNTKILEASQDDNLG
jgi:hypothetical protein